MAFREIFLKLIKLAKNTWLSILKNIIWNFVWWRLKSYDSVSEQKKKKKCLNVNNKSDQLWKTYEFEPKNLHTMQNNVNISTTTWSEVHLICRISIIVVTKIFFQKVTFQVFNMSNRCYLIVFMLDSYWPIRHSKRLNATTNL